MRNTNRTVEKERRTSKTRQPKANALEQTPSDIRLNKLIEDYRAENERCVYKISELKERLQNQPDRYTPEKLSVKSFKVKAGSASAQRSSQNRARPQSSGFYKKNMRRQGLTSDFERMR